MYLMMNEDCPVDPIRIKAAKSLGQDLTGEQASFSTPTSLEAKIILGTPNNPQPK